MLAGLERSSRRAILARSRSSERKPRARPRHELAVRRRISASFVLLLALACRAPAPQAPPAEAAGPCPWTVGEWRGTRTDAARGEPEPMAVRVRPVLGGAGRIEELEVVHGGGVYRGLHVLVLDVERGRWVSHYANDVKGRFVPLEGSALGEGFVWLSAAPGRTRESRLVYERPAGERWRRRQEVSQDGGASWRVLFTDELERVAR
jgi:hypothetical protein